MEDIFKSPTTPTTTPTPNLISAFHPCLSSSLSSPRPHWRMLDPDIPCNLQPLSLFWLRVDPSLASGFVSLFSIKPGNSLIPELLPVNLHKKKKKKKDQC